MIEFAVTLIKEYGPLMLGWPIAGWLLIRCDKRDKVHREDVIKFTEAMGKLQSTLMVLSERMR